MDIYVFSSKINRSSSLSSKKDIASELNLDEKIKVELKNSNIYYDDVIHLGSLHFYQKSLIPPSFPKAPPQDINTGFTADISKTL